MSAAPGEVLVFGAGSVGCFVGGRLAAAGCGVRFIGRQRVIGDLHRVGLTLSDLDGPQRQLPPAALQAGEHLPEGLSPALVLLCVKSGATAAAAAQLAAALPAGTPVLSLQNGVSNVAIAQARAPRLRLLAGMVPFNIAELGPGRFHRGTSGQLAAQADTALAPWGPMFQAAGLPLQLYADLRPVQWGKLLLNLNNPVNALSGLPLRAQLLDRGYRRCLAALMDEALAVMAAAGIQPARLAAVPPGWLPALLRLPTPVFRRLAARMLRIDDRARSSMADDLRRGRPTEVDAICGEVLRLARAHGRAAPLSERMVRLVAAAPAAPGAGGAAWLWDALHRP